MSTILAFPQQRQSVFRSAAALETQNKVFETLVAGLTKLPAHQHRAFLIGALRIISPTPQFEQCSIIELADLLFAEIDTCAPDASLTLQNILIFSTQTLEGVFDGA